jgi:hypothetical protein
MSDKLMQSQKLLHDSLFELYMQGGLELYLAGTSGLKRELIIRLETSALTPQKGEIIHYYAVNRWDENEEFDEYTSPSRPLTLEAERILGVTNSQLECCRTNATVLRDFLEFLDCNVLRNSGVMKSAVLIGTEWTVVSTRPNETVHGKSFATEAEARAYAKELASQGYKDISIKISK